MTGPTEVARLKNQLDATFERARILNQDAELQSDFARYLCVLVSGYIEKVIIELVLEHVRENGKPTLQRFVERKMKRFPNPNPARILELLGDFDPRWQKEIKKFLADETRDVTWNEAGDAIWSVANQRNKIVHGETVEITYKRISAYYQQVQRVIERVTELFSNGLELPGTAPDRA